MKYLTLDGKRVKFVHYMPFDETHGLHKSREELLKTGVLVEEIPEPETIEGKIPHMCYDEEKGIYYEYTDAPKPAPTAADIEALHAKLDYIGMMTEVL